MKSRALELLSAELSVIPVKCDGTKAPALGSFEEYKSKRRATADEVDGWFPEGAMLGVAIICGPLSGNLVVLDFEKKETFTAWSEIVRAEDLPIDELPIVETPRGFHVYARTPEPHKGKKLANELVEVEGKDGGRHVRPKTLIEFRGAGQYVVGPGSPKEVHPLPVSEHGGWTHRWGPDVTETPKITAAEWEGFCRCAQTFNETIEHDRIVDGLGSISADDQRPGTDFCRRATRQEFSDLLERHGWEAIREDKGGRIIFRRPGKAEPGGSATLGAVTTSLGDCLYVFSTNAEPFQAETCYSIFAARALLDFGGDFGRAAGQARVEGYGKPAPEEIREEVAGYIEHWSEPANLRQLADEVDNLRAISLAFRKTWDRLSAKQKEIGDDPHRYTRSILYQAITRLGSPEEAGLKKGIGLVRLWREKYGEDPSRATDAEYMSRQAADVLSLAELNENEVHARCEAREAGETQESRLSWLSAKFGLTVDGFIQYRAVAEEATFWIVVSGKRIKIGDIKSWETFEAFERALRGWAACNGTGSGVPGFLGGLPENLAPKVMWRGVQIVLYQIREVHGAEDTVSHAIFGWAHEYGDQSGLWGESEENEDEDRWRQSAITGLPFVLDGRLWLSLDHFLRWVNAHKNETFTRRGLIDQLRSGGFEKLKKQPTDIDGRRKERHFWTCRLDELPAQRAEEEDHVPF